jgi:3-dehydroquinate synthetase
MSMEAQIVQYLTGLLALVVSGLLTYLARNLKAFVNSHTTAKNAAIANTVIDGLSAITEAVVQDFNQRVVADAKKNGVFTPQLAQSVKEDAVAAVKSQGASLVALGSGVIGDVDGLISSLVEKAVANSK